jgi:hypothetical protein
LTRLLVTQKRTAARAASVARKAAAKAAATAKKAAAAARARQFGKVGGPLKARGKRLGTAAITHRETVARNRAEAAQRRAAEKAQKAQQRAFRSQDKAAQRAAARAKKALDRSDKALANIKAKAAARVKAHDLKEAKKALRVAKKRGERSLGEQALDYLKGRLNLPNAATALQLVTGKPQPGASEKAIEQDKDCQDADQKRRDRIAREARCAGVKCC